MANESKENKKSKFPVVGIGASAGGLKAFEAFFKHLPENPGMAFVLIQHLDPNHRSELSELLQNHTRLPVRQVEETTEVEPDHVYVIPPNKRLSIENKLLKLSERDKQRGSQAVIDLFFRALASDLGEQAVCIVLSGTGTDGTQGLKAIKEAGGITFAQSENDAEYSGMPRSAEQTGLVDFVLPAAEIGTRLVEVKDHAANLSLPEDETKLPQDDNEVLQRIMTQLHSRTGHDFSNYKKTTVLRRIRRRMQVQKYSQLADYLSYLRTDEGEATELFKELLISVTNFFRDPEAFRALETSVIPELFHQEEIRVWVAGCATGEEAYSVAILLAEYSSLKNQRHHIQVFASDLDDSALSFARKGVYPDTISADVSQERLDRFFQHEGDFYVVKDELREMVLFANHNLIKDPPFSKLGLITCRNLLIYLNSEVQEQVYKLFHYALGSKGWLFLGSSESLGKAAKLFKEEDKKAKLFLRQDVSEPGIHFPVTPVLKDAVVNTEETEPDQNGIATQARQAILRGYAPAFAVVNKNSDIVYLSQGTGKYLEHPEGEVSHNIVQQAKDGLGLELRTALYRLFKNNISTLNKTILVRKNGESVHLALSVKRLDQSEHALVVFDENVETRFIARTPELIAQEDQHLAAQLDEELRHTRESLQTTIEELETSNEELRASNEELQSMNEELQSTSEELETSKEELQSTNEELATVNQELRNKIEELAAVNSDLENLISSTDVGTVFLDADLRVKRFTPKATDVFNLISTDIGRPFSHISNLVEVSHLARDTARVLETLQPINHKVNSEKGSFLLRIFPYRTVDNRIDGVVITSVDVTELEQARAEALRRTQQQAAVAELGKHALSGESEEHIFDLATRRVAETLNVDYVKILEKRPDETLLLLSGVGWAEGLVGKAKVDAGANSQAGFTLQSNSPVIVRDLASETRFRGPALLTDHSVVSGISVIIQGQDQAWGVLGAHTLKQRDFSHDDINFVLSIANTLAEFIRQRQAAVALQEANTLLEQRVAERTEELKEANFVLKEQETFLRSIYNEVGLAVYVVDVRDGFKHLDVNPGFIEMTKVDRERVVGKRPHELEHLPEENREMMLASYQQVVQTKRALAYEIMSPDPAGETWWLVTLNPVLDDSGEVYRIIGTGLSITSRVQAEQEIRAQKEFIELLINSSLDGIMAFDTELKYTLWNNGMQRISGIAPEEAIGKVSYEVFPFLKESGELEQFKKTLQGQIVTSHDQYYEVPKTNHQGFFEAHYTPLKTGEDNVIGGLGIIRETSERKRALDRLRSSEERFRTIFDQGTSAACLLILEDWLIIDVNQKCENILGYKRGDLRGKDLRQLKLWQNPAELIALEKLIETENTKRDQDLHILRDKEDGILCASVELINYSGQDHLLLIFEDISEQRRNEAELREMRLKLLEMEEKERLELARELHDGVIQQLLGFNQALSQMEKDIKASKGQTPINVKSYHESAQELVDQLRRTIIDLRPPGLEEFGLKASLEGFLTYLNSQEIKGSPHLSWQLDETDSIPLDISRVLFRTAQEALRNALSHASAKELHLELSIESNNIYLTITDDGKGFTLPERLSKFAQENHFGLLGMEERLELFNGSLKLESELGKGTTLKVSLPLEARGA